MNQSKKPTEGEVKNFLDQAPPNDGGDAEQQAKKSVKKKKKILSYQNKPNTCAQLWDLTTMHWHHLFGRSCMANVCMILVPIICVGSFFAVKSIVKIKSYPDYHLQRLKHPVYSTVYYDPEIDEFDSNFDTELQQQLKFEDFFNFADYGNTVRVTGKDENGQAIKKKSYSPGLDQTGPAAWLPMQCYSTVDYKYASPVIGIIKNGNQLEEDMLIQIQKIFADQTKIDEFGAALEKFLASVDLGGGGDEEDEEAGEEEEELIPGDPNAFTVPKELADEAGGAPKSAHEINTATMGRFTYKEFESVDEMFMYVQSEGYGWDPDIPSICFAFQIQENEAKNRYELEWFYRDSYPTMYATGLRLDKKVEPMSSASILLGYTRVAYNGINMMQVFAANSIMQRRLSPEAEIVMFTVPYKIPIERTYALNVMVSAKLSDFTLMVSGPLAFFIAYKIGLEKETGMRQLLSQNGMNPVMHFLSWLFQYTVLNFGVTLIYTIALGQVVFEEDSFGLLFLMHFMAFQSLFGLIWALQPFSKTGRMAVVAFFALFCVSYFASYLIDQNEPVIETSWQKVVGILPLAAIKRTQDILAKFHYIFWAMNFENWHLIKLGWSLKIGVEMYCFNFLFWTCVGILFDFLLHTPCRCISNLFKIKVNIANDTENVLKIESLKERNQSNLQPNSKSAPVYDFTVKKGKVCCLIGNNCAQKTNLLEMIAGVRACERGGTMSIKDSDFFTRGSRPSISDYLVYRSSEVILDNEMTAIEHLNLFAHIRGNQKHRNTRLLCDKLLPEKLKVGEYSESQRQFLQTLIALVSDNTKVLILDEPTRGLGPEQRSELIKNLWRFKRDRYIIISSSDAELVNMLADSVAKVLQYGIQMVSQQEIDHKLASYKLSVEVEGGKPSNNLVKYLTHEVEAGLTLEYHSELMTHYILPNIPKSLLHKKSRFMENNKDVLGLINFEFVSLTEFEVAQRNIVDPKNLIGAGADSFEESVEDDVYEGDDVRSEFQPADQVDQLESVNRGLLLSSVDLNEVIDNMAGGAYHKKRAASNFMMRPDEVNTGEEVEQEENKSDQNKATEAILEPEPIDVQPELDPEMKEFLKLQKSVLKRPNYKRELFYDFKKFRARRKNCCTQCCGIFARHWKENWNRKLRCLGLLVLPALSIYLSYYCCRSYFHSDNDSRLVDPDWFTSNKILVNEKTIIGDKDTKKWIESLPKYDEAFEVSYVSTEGQEIFLDYHDQIFDHFTTQESSGDQPWSYGSYQFYDMDEEKNKYMFLTHVNLTSPFSTLLYPQFMIESVMKHALDDDDFEFKVRQTPFPSPLEIAEKGNFLSSQELAYTKIFVTMSDEIGFWGIKALEVSGFICFAFLAVNLVVLLNSLRDRMSGRKHYFESHGQSKLAYWLAKFAHDIVFYVPICVVSIYLINKFDPQMEQAGRSIMVAPFVMLPIIYVAQFLFVNEVSALMFLFIYQITVQFVIPFMIVAVRLNSTSEKLGDRMYSLAKILPMESVMSTIIYNGQTLRSMARFRENNKAGVGEDIETDELHSMNAQADLTWMVVHIIVSWVLLIFIIEYRLHCICCDPRRMKEISQHDNDVYFGKAQVGLEDIDDELPKDSESSEIPQIIGEGDNIKLRFNVRQKPRQELAIKVQELNVQQRRGCCAWLCCRKVPPNQVLIKDLAIQVQAGSKFAILADSSQGKSHIVDTLTSRRSAMKVSATLSRQLGRGAPVYTSQRSDLVFFNECTLKQNFDYYLKLGSVHPRLVKQMIASFGLFNRQEILMCELTETERHLTQLILALSGSNRTVILDEPFSGLTSEQNLKLVKIIRQKHDCTVIVTAKSKAQIELLQPHQIIEISRRAQDRYSVPGTGQLLALRLRYNFQSRAEDDKSVDGDEIDETDLLNRTISQNYSIFEKLRFKKRSIVLNVVNKLMRKAKMSPLVAEAIAEMVHEDLELEMTSEEMVIKCQLIRQLYQVVETLCQRFGECHIELKQDEYTVLRVISNQPKAEITPETARANAPTPASANTTPAPPNGTAPTQTEKANTVTVGTASESQLTFSDIVNFVNTDECIKASALSCHFLSARHNITQGRTKTGMKPVVKMFRFSEKKGQIERMNPSEGVTTSQVSQSTQPLN